MISLDTIAILTLVATTAGTAGFIVVSRRRREVKDNEVLEDALSRHSQPATLHPRIDGSKCMACLSCTAACPEGDIIGLVKGQAKLLDPAACIGHGRCVVECPNDAIRLVMGSSARGIDLPEVSESFESSRAGVHVVGELGGMGLIRNAINQGLALADELGDSLRPGREKGVVDVAIVGAGPAGIATAMGLKAQGLSFRVLEQEASFGGTISHYPRQKLVMTEPTELPGYGTFGRRVIPKEELLEMMQQALDRTDIDVECGTKVQGVDGSDGAFVVQTTRGQVRTRKVVLATGRRGTPRRLGVPGEELPKVAYSLIDAEQYDGQQVLVVGGGDSALEAAIALAERSSAKVYISYHRKQFQRGRSANREKLDALIRSGRVKGLMDSKVAEIRKREVVLATGERRVRVPNDFVLVCAGGELPTEFLDKAGVGLRRYWGTELGSTGEVSVVGPIPQARATVRKHRRLLWGLSAVAAVVLGVLMVKGGGYYLLDKAGRKAHEGHDLLKASGLWGHGVGIIATLLLSSTLLYSLRKRIRAFKGARPIRGWLTFHQFAGLLGTAMIAFHSAFRSSSALATATLVALLLVVATGIFGHFVRAVAPRPGTELSALLGRWSRLKQRVGQLTQNATDALSVNFFLSRATAEPEPAGLMSLLFRLPAETLQYRRDVRRLRPLFIMPGTWEDFDAASRRLWTLRVQARFHEALRTFVASWRIVHIVLSVVLGLLVVTHVLVSLYLGHRWIWS